MQILFTKSYEMGKHKGLDLIKGKVISIKEKQIIKNLKCHILAGIKSLLIKVWQIIKKKILII